MLFHAELITLEEISHAIQSVHCVGSVHRIVFDSVLRTVKASVIRSYMCHIKNLQNLSMVGVIEGSRLFHQLARESVDYESMRLTACTNTSCYVSVKQQVISSVIPYSNAIRVPHFIVFRNTFRQHTTMYVVVLNGQVSALSYTLVNEMSCEEARSYYINFDSEPYDVNDLYIDRSGTEYDPEGCLTYALGERRICNDVGGLFEIPYGRVIEVDSFQIKYEGGTGNPYYYIISDDMYINGGLFAIIKGIGKKHFWKDKPPIHRLPTGGMLHRNRECSIFWKPYSGTKRLIGIIGWE